MLKVEMFGEVPQHQSAAMNFHLGNMLEAFDKEYVKAGGKIGSLTHLYDQIKFAQLSSESMLKHFKGNNGIIETIQTTTTLNCESLKTVIGIETESCFDSTTSPMKLLDYSGYYLN